MRDELELNEADRQHEEAYKTLQELATAHLESEAPAGSEGNDSRRRALRQEADRESVGPEQERRPVESRRRARRHRRGSFI